MKGPSNIHVCSQAIIFALLILVARERVEANAGGVNINLKSKKISNILNPQEAGGGGRNGGPSLNRHDMNAPPTGNGTGMNKESKSTQKKSPLSNPIKLDLAGELQTHLSSPSLIAPNGIPIGHSVSDPSDAETTPLFQWGKVQVYKANDANNGITNTHVPTVHVGAKYDFKRAWYGATRLMTTLSWGRGNCNSLRNGDSDANMNAKVVSKVRGEVGLIDSDDYSVELALKFPTSKEGQLQRLSSSSASVKYDTRLFGGHGATMSTSASIHPRLGVVLKGIVLLGEQGLLRGLSGLRLKSNLKNGMDNHYASTYLMGRIPQEEVSWSEGSWLPDVNISAGGKIVTKSAIGLRRGGSAHNRIGVRLMASRQLNWNIIGILKGGDEAEYSNDTMLKLEVGGVGQGTYTSISAEAAIERIRETFRCTLLQERIFSL